MIPQSDDITERFYPEPDIHPQTPAFDGRDGFSTHADVLQFLIQYQPPQGSIYRIDTLGKSQNGLPIAIAYLGSNAPDALRIWVMGGLHGDEPGGWEGIMHFMNRLQEADKSAWLSQVQLALLPMANPDGCNALNRLAANGLDLNRDQTKLLAPETMVWKEAFNQFQPEVALDMHEYRAFRKDYLRMGTQGMAAYYDVCFLYSGNLNVPDELRNYTRNAFVAQAERWMDSLQLAHHAYFTSDEVKGRRVINQGSVHARSSASHHALTNCISTLIEVRGVGIGKTSFKRRVLASSSVILSYVDYAVAHKTEVRELLQRAHLSKADPVVLSKRKEEERKLLLIDLAKKDTVRVSLPVRDAFQSTATLSRKRPKAYVLRQVNADITERLKALGVEFSPILEKTEMQAEAYRVTSTVPDAFNWEGVRPVEVNTLLESITLSIDPSASNDILIPLDQKNAPLVFELMEPEALNSFVHLGLIQATQDQQLPIYRIMP